MLHPKRAAHGLPYAREDDEVLFSALEGIDGVELYVQLNSAVLRAQRSRRRVYVI